MKLIAITVFLLVSCREPYEQLPNQDEAVKLIWNGYYMQAAEPPTVEWRSQRCGQNLDKYAVIYQNMCYGGLYLYWADHILTAMPVNGKIWASALPHELMHARQWNDGGILDYNHERPEWAEVATVINELKSMDW